MIQGKLRMAQAILELLEPELYGRPALLAQTYCNGREQGFAIIEIAPQSHRMVAFAQNCNSDEIVVYAGTRDDFRENGNIPTDECKPFYFQAGAYTEVITFIRDYLTEEPITAASGLLALTKLRQRSSESDKPTSGQ